MFAQNFKYLKFYNHWFCKLVNYKEALIINQAKQNHVFASVTYKIRRTDFSARTERGEFSRLSEVHVHLIGV